MLQSARSMLIFVVFASSALAEPNFEKECLEYFIEGELIPGGYLERYSERANVELPLMREIFKGATLAFLNTWEINPFSDFPIDLRLKMAVYAVRAETGSLFSETKDTVLWWMLFNLAIATRHQIGRAQRDFCIDVVACSVLQNVFPLALRSDPKTIRYRAFSKRTLKIRRRQINEAIDAALRKYPLHLDRMVHRAELVKHLSQITCMRFGWSALQYKMELYVRERLPVRLLRIPALIEFARRSLSQQAILSAMVVMHSRRQD